MMFKKRFNYGKVGKIQKLTAGNINTKTLDNVA